MSIKSAILLSLGSLLLLTAVTCIVVGFATDFWLKYDVHHNNIISDLRRQHPGIRGLDSVNRTKLLVDRTRGLFHWCYPDKRPFDLMRTQIAFFIIAFLFFLLAFIVGIVGCWKRNALQILATGLLILFATLFAAAATAIFHGIKHIESNVLRDVPESLTTFNVPEVIRSNTKMRFWWSYMLCWIGVGLALLSALIFFLTSCFLHRDQKTNRRYMHNYNTNKVVAGGSIIAGSVGPKDRYLVPVYYDNTNAAPPPPGMRQGGYDSGRGGNTVYYDNGYYRSPPSAQGGGGPGGEYYRAGDRVVGGGNPNISQGNSNTAGYGYGYYK
ncbi:uncharacterized protein LOC135925747 isoform X2 [Gordionus sp. m RMFG-2023]|uniref:uncharacterized protein LOC135925747 isoform X2 n=1 Tax=Gordionus sp. m RMFG-2023 TaxID=3053472 RepID=UPI0031FC511D